MLVLSLKIDERVRIGEDVWITLVRTRDGAARIGIDAPRDVKVLREELIGKPPRPVAA